ncbi:predicted protein [Arabidopsis lyrata subsp. lyrata]|uniref:Predicted protein n=1 Tax=Arabidopsis lyrata subsp. lyrata TaxID=81972 RepID=D7LMC2_ARALL|nr:predicted protein [Arabidopsis lyrata subsp. lyrata]
MDKEALKCVGVLMLEEVDKKPSNRSSEHKRSRIKDRKRGCLDWERPHFGVSGQSRHRDMDVMLGRRPNRLSVGLNSLASSPY